MAFSPFGKHPPGLVVCFSTELWERFSYYGMRALLVFFLTQHFRFSDQYSFLLYGTYTALVYMTPVIGGVAADRYLGARKAVTLGAILLVLGHFGMALEGPEAQEIASGGQTTVVRDPFFLGVFYLSLALIITGVGFLKTNTSSLVGTLYPEGDPRRDAGFTVYYMGINIGGAAAPLLCGWIGQTYGWRYGFGLAGIGMLAGLVGFRRGQHHLLGRAEPPDPKRLEERILPGVTRETLIYLLTMALVAGIWWILQRPAIVGRMLSVFGLATGAFILYYAFARCDRSERSRLLVCAVLIAFTIGFWAFYEQMGSSLNLFADRMVDRVIWGREIPASTLQALPSIFVILLAPPFGALWFALAKRGREPNTAFKFSLAIAFVGMAFFVLVFGTRLAGSGKVGLIWFALNFLFLVMGELCLSPVGMSMVTKLSPQRVVGLMMGTFFLAYSGSSFIAGIIARLTSSQTVGGAVTDHATALATYASVYTRLGLMATGVAVLLLIISPLFRRGMEEPRAAGPLVVAPESPG